MSVQRSPRSHQILTLLMLLIPFGVGTARADEFWVAPTSQQDVGGLEIASNTVWPVTPVGAVRFAFAIPDNLQAFQSARVVLIPHAPGGAANLNTIICAAQNNGLALGSCAGVAAQPFTGVANQLIEVDISAMVAPKVGTPGATYLTVVAYTAPTTLTDHVVGLRFAYAPVGPASNTVGSSQVLDHTLTADDLAPGSVGVSEVAFNYAASTSKGGPATDVACASCVAASEVSFAFATPGANTFTGPQVINSGNLDLDASSLTSGNITKNGRLFIHNFGTDFSVSTSTFVGVDAGNLTSTGTVNTGVGRLALTALTSGTYASALGYGALAGNTTGHWNTAAGALALTFNTTGSRNSAVGENALRDNTSGESNTAMGQNALLNHETGDNNVAFGASAGFLSATGSNNIYIGADVLGIAGESNTMYLGKVGTQVKTLIAGVRGITTGTNNAIPVLIDSAGQLGTVSSSRRVKQDIHDMADASRRLFDLRPVTFRYTKEYADGSKPIQFGLIAEEVADAFPELAARGANGEIETVHYETLNVLLLNEVQKQQQRIDVLERQVSELLNVMRASR